MSERQASTFRKGDFTAAHIRALSILSENKVAYLAEQTVNAWGEFDHEGRPIVYRVDILINDTRYGSGVIEIDGLVHKHERQIIKDIRKDKRLKAMGLWVERIENANAETVMEVLEQHRVQVDEYGGRS